VKQKVRLRLPERKGKNRLDRTIDGNVDLILNILAKTRPGHGTVPYDGTTIQELTDLTPNEINDAVGLLEEAGFVTTTQMAPENNPFSFYQAQISQRGTATANPTKTCT
jgi:hypothetical protein